MSVYSFDPDNLATYGVDWVRFQVQDTDPGNWLLANQEVQMCLDSERNMWGAAAQACEVIARSFLRKQDVKLGRALTIAYAKAAQQYLEMAAQLRRKSLGTIIPFVGGMSKTVKFTYQQNTDLIQGTFQRQMQENPWTGGYSADSLGPFIGDNDDAGFEFE